MAMRPWGGVEWEGGGDRKVLQQWRQYAANMPAIAAQVLADEVGVELVEAQRRTPFDVVNDRNPVHLRETGRIEGPTSTDDGIEVRIIFGGASVGAPYAVKQHQAHHDHAEGEREYLLSVFEESKRFLAGRLVRRLEARQAEAVRG